MRLMEKKAGLILGGILLFSLVLVVGVAMAVATPDVASAGATVTVNEFLDITLSGTVPITFGGLDPGTPDNLATSGAITITIQSVTNVVTDTFLKGTSWTTPTTLDINNVKYDDDGTINSNEFTMSTTYAAENNGFFEDATCPCGGVQQQKVYFSI